MVHTGDSSYHPAPEWLTVDYMEKVLRKYKRDEKLKIVNLHVKPVTTKGENYASVMTRIKVTLDVQGAESWTEESYIVKTTHESDPFIAGIMKPYKTFETEMEMYGCVLPALTELLREAGDQDKLFADTVNVDYDHSAIILEDLSVSKFVVADRISGYDMMHAKLALTKLAKMHAAAAVLNQRTSGSLQHFDRGFFNRHTQGLAPYFLNMFEICADFARSCEELGPYYADKVKILKRHLVEYAARVYDSRDHYFNTLVHGDFWINNIMLRYNERTQPCDKKSMRDVMLIDFQFCAWASPAVDLHYFFNTSLEGDVRLHHQEELVQHYYEVLRKTLSVLKYVKRIPTLHEFWLQWEEGRFYAVTSALVVQPVMINDKTEDADLNGLILEDERGRNFRKLLYANPVVQKYVKTLLPIFDRRGLLDIRH